VPPDGWNPPNMIDFDDIRLLQTRLQEIHTLQEGHTFDDGEKYTIRGYKEMAETFENRWKELHYAASGYAPKLEELEKNYWDLVETAGLGREHIDVEYANDIDTTIYRSGFPLGQRGPSWTGIEPDDCPDMFSDAYYRRCGWNLNNIPSVQGSLLKYVEAQIPGVMVPWLYVGMLFTSFCWHAEDNFFMSVNYAHFGAPKQWYGIPEKGAKAFEQAAREMLPEAFKESPDLLHHMTTQISPNVLLRRNVPVFRVTQDPKTFIITFPRAFHGGFNYGFNCNEAVNFATPAWLPFGAVSQEKYRSLGKDSVISHSRLVMTLANHMDALPRDCIAELTRQILTVVSEELSNRMEMEKDHVRVIPVPKNDFSRIDKMASDYDEKRECDLCKHVCVLSAYACACSNKRVTCLRHRDVMCKCPSTQKYLLAWMSIPELRLLQTKATYLHKVFSATPGSTLPASPDAPNGTQLDEQKLLEIAKTKLF